MLWKSSLILIATLVVTSFCPMASNALEGKAGEVIKTEADLKELRDKNLICEGFYRDLLELVENGHPIEIVETSDRTKLHSDTYLKLTEQNKGKATIGPNGELLNFEGGRPFPDLTPDDPQVAIKAAWNFYYRYTGDAWKSTWEYYLTDAKGHVKKLWGTSHYAMFNFRTDIPPKPQLDPKDSSVRRKALTTFDGPFESKGLSQLALKYVDPSRDDDVWVYVPGLRRANRSGAGAGCDALGGFVSVVDDDWGFNANPMDFNFKFIRATEMLVPALTKAKPQVIEGLRTIPVQLEKRKLWVIEATAKDANYCYSKREWFLDPENYYIANSQNYDRAGALWKNYWLTFSTMTNGPEVGGQTPVQSGSVCTDFKIGEGGPSASDVQMNVSIPIGVFSLDYMRKGGR